MLGFTFSCKFDWDFDIILTAKAATHKIGALMHSMKLLYIWPCMEYCCHVGAAAPSCFLEMLSELQKLICRTVGPSLAASLGSSSKCSQLISFL